MYYAAYPTVHISAACVPALPPLTDDRGRERTVDRTQIIVPGYQFTCHGKVTSWSACVDPGGRSERYTIHFQVWRPTGTDVDCFYLVGDNFPTEALDPSGSCVDLEVPPGEEIVVMPGDVIGFHSAHFREMRGNLEERTDGGLQIDHEILPVQTFFNLATTAVGEVYAVSKGDQVCRGPSGDQSSESFVGAPVISVNVGQF